MRTVHAITVCPLINLTLPRRYNIFYGRFKCVFHNKQLEFDANKDNKQVITPDVQLELLFRQRRVYSHTENHNNHLLSLAGATVWIVPWKREQKKKVFRSVNVKSEHNNTSSCIRCLAWKSFHSRNSMWPTAPLNTIGTLYYLCLNEIGRILQSISLWNRYAECFTLQAKENQKKWNSICHGGSDGGGGDDDNGGDYDKSIG